MGVSVPLPVIEKGESNRKDTPYSVHNAPRPALVDSVEAKTTVTVAHRLAMQAHPKRVARSGMITSFILMPKFTSRIKPPPLLWF